MNYLVDKIIKFIPFGTLLIIFCGYLKLKFYYSLFEININPYISISDVINLFLSDTIYLIYTLSAPLYNLISKHGINEEIKEEEIRLDERNKVYRKVISDFSQMMDKLKIDENEQLKSPVKSKIKKKHFMYISFLVLLIIIFIIMVNQIQNTFITQLYLLLAVFFPIALYKSFDDTKWDLGKNYFSILFVTSLFLLMIARINEDYFNATHNLKQTTIITEDKNYVIDENLIKVGNSQEYTFLYYKNSSCITILRNETIKVIESTAHNRL